MAAPLMELGIMPHSWQPLGALDTPSTALHHFPLQTRATEALAVTMPRALPLMARPSARATRASKIRAPPACCRVQQHVRDDTMPEIPSL